MHVCSRVQLLLQAIKHHVVIMPLIDVHVLLRQVEDEVLNSFVPINVAAPPLPSCTDQYQSTNLRAFVDWTTGGGAGSGDTLANADVTRFVSFSVNDTDAVQVAYCASTTRRGALLILVTTSKSAHAVGVLTAYYQ